MNIYMAGVLAAVVAGAAQAAPVTADYEQLAG